MRSPSLPTDTRIGGIVDDRMKWLGAAAAAESLADDCVDAGWDSRTTSSTVASSLLTRPGKPSKASALNETRFEGNESSSLTLSEGGFAAVVAGFSVVVVFGPTDGVGGSTSTVFAS